MMDSATWTREFWNSLASCSSAVRLGADGVLWGTRIRLQWDVQGGSIEIEWPAHGRRAVRREAFPIFRNYDPAREARELAAYLYGHTHGLRRSA